jgi:hypothetical protein
VIPAFGKTKPKPSPCVPGPAPHTPVRNTVQKTQHAPRNYACTSAHPPTAVPVAVVSELLRKVLRRPREGAHAVQQALGAHARALLPFIVDPLHAILIAAVSAVTSTELVTAIATLVMPHSTLRGGRNGQHLCTGASLCTSIGTRTAPQNGGAFHMTCMGRISHKRRFGQKEQGGSQLGIKAIAKTAWQSATG